MPLWARIFLNEFLFAFLCVATTRAYVENAYASASVFECALASLLFYDKRMTFEDDRARSWDYGYPAHVTGAVLGMLLGMLLVGIKH